jgi:predicted DCC family thiol-disulfide oxidoreductase YuxK
MTAPASGNPGDVEGTVVFDGDCGFCTRGRDLLVRLDRHSRVRTVPFQRPGVPGSTGLSSEQLAGSVWWLGADGRRAHSAEAVNAALSAALGTRLPLAVYRLPGVRQAQEAVYRLVAANRHRLPGARPWCRAHPEDCAA